MGNQEVKISSRGEVCWAVIGIVGCVGVASAIAPKDKYFLPNALFYLFSQLGVVIFALIGLPRPAAVGGVAVAVSLYLMAFWTWVQASRDQ